MILIRRNRRTVIADSSIRITKRTKQATTIVTDDPVSVERNIMLHQDIVTRSNTCVIRTTEWDIHCYSIWCAISCRGIPTDHRLYTKYAHTIQGDVSASSISVCGIVRAVAAV